MNDVRTRAINLIREKSEVDASEISNDTPLAEMDIQSLELIDIVLELEDEYDIEIDMNAVEAWETFKTVGDVVDAIETAVASSK